MAKRRISEHQQYAIGSTHIPGLSKFIEEVGEALQIVGKIMGLGRFGKHWDGKNLRRELEDEMADVLAAANFVIERNGLDRDRIDKRVKKKIERFNRWHFNVQAGRDPNDNG